MADRQLHLPFSVGEGVQIAVGQRSIAHEHIVEQLDLRPREGFADRHVLAGADADADLSPGLAELLQAGDRFVFPRAAARQQPQRQRKQQDE